MPFQIDGFIWLEAIVDKIISKHQVDPREVEDCFSNIPYKVKRADEEKYYFLGQTNGGRYIAVVFVWEGRKVKVITARDMTFSERRYFKQK